MDSRRGPYSIKNDMDKLKYKALQHCANWDSGKCSGCMIKCELDGTVRQVIDNKLSGKECNPKDCTYFENLVEPMLQAT